jgi:hypothetical protein
MKTHAERMIRLNEFYKDLMIDYNEQTMVTELMKDHVEYATELMKTHADMEKDIPSLMNWYASEVVKPAKKLLEDASGVSELGKILTWCNDNSEHTVFQNDVVIRFLEIRDKIKALPSSDDDYLMAFDATSPYPSAMWDNNSEFP